MKTTLITISIILLVLLIIGLLTNWFGLSKPKLSYENSNTNTPKPKPVEGSKCMAYHPLNSFGTPLGDYVELPDVEGVIKNGVCVASHF